VRIYDSILFYDYDSGCKFMYEVSKLSQYPASLRLVDNQQFQFGQTMKPANKSSWDDFVDAAKKFFVMNIKGFNPEKMVAATLLCEGDKEDQELLHKRVMAISRKYNGMAGGAENGQKGYLLTYLIAYTRDFAFDYNVVAESFETSVPWSNVVSMQANV